MTKITLKRKCPKKGSVMEIYYRDTFNLTIVKAFTEEPDFFSFELLYLINDVINRF